MSQERKTLATYSGAAIGGHASQIRFVEDEAGRLEVSIGAGPNTTVAIIDEDQAGEVAFHLNKAFGTNDPKDRDKREKDRQVKADSQKQTQSQPSRAASQPTEPARPLPGAPAKNPAGGVPSKGN